MKASQATTANSPETPALGSSSTASSNAEPPAAAMPPTVSTRKIANVTRGPARATFSSVPGLSASRSIRAMPPKIQSWMPVMPIPLRMAAKAWPSSCRTIEPKNPAAVRIPSIGRTTTSATTPRESATTSTACASRSRSRRAAGRSSFAGERPRPVARLAARDVLHRHPLLRARRRSGRARAALRKREEPDDMSLHPAFAGFLDHNRWIRANAARTDPPMTLLDVTTLAAAESRRGSGPACRRRLADGAPVRRCGSRRPGRASGSAFGSAGTAGRRGRAPACRLAARVDRRAHQLRRGLEREAAVGLGHVGQPRPRREPRAHSDSAIHMFPMPATSVWSCSVSPNVRVPSARRMRASIAVEVRRRGEDVRPEPGERARVQLEHRPVPEHALRPRPAQHEPRPAHARLAARPHGPAPAHAQVRADDDAALEAQHEVLADGLDRVEAAPVDLLGDALGLRARVRRLDLEPLADEHLQAACRAVERVALGHLVRVVLDDARQLDPPMLPRFPDGHGRLGERRVHKRAERYGDELRLQLGDVEDRRAAVGKNEYVSRSPASERRV